MLLRPPLDYRRAALAGCCAALAASPAPALNFSFGDLRATFDTTISAGWIHRLDDPDPDLVGVANGGRANSINVDDGNLNYRRGTASLTLKATHDLELSYGEHLGAFARFYYFRDWENADGARARTELSGEARDRVAQRFDYLDLYGRLALEVAGHPLDVRFGRQVLSLGESTFIPNGLNIVNPVELSALRVPGAELREAFLPVNMLNVSASLTDDLTLQAFWLLEFRRTEIEPAGTYFSTNDFVSRGGTNVFLGFGQPPVSDRGTLGAIPRNPNRDGGNFDQWGIAVRYLAAGLADTEFGFYFARFHSRLPVISAVTPTTPVNTNLTGPLTQVFVGAGLPLATAQAQAAGLWQLIVMSQMSSVQLTPQQLATLTAPQSQAAIAGARSIALLTSAATGRYFIEYPEDIQMFGASFNADLARTGISWQGEVSLKQDTPLQIDDVEILFATLGGVAPPFATNNQLSNFLGQLGREVTGYRREDVWTAQTTLTKVFGPMLGASQLILVGEIGGVWVPDLPAKSTLRFDGPGTFTSGSQAAMTAGGYPTLAATPESAFADDFSWGYALVARLDYNNLFAGVNVSPTLAFTQDVSGNTPLPLGNFLEGRKSLNLSAEFVWQQQWALEVRYVEFFGAHPRNLLGDRDYVSTSLKYSF